MAVAVALVSESDGRWSYALATPTTEIHHGQLEPARLGSSFPPDVSPIVSRIGNTVEMPAEMVVILEDSDPDPETTALAVQDQLAGRARIVGVAVVGRDEVLALLREVRPAVHDGANAELIVAAVNDGSSGPFGSAASFASGVRRWRP